MDEGTDAEKALLGIVAFGYIFFEPWVLLCLWRWFALSLGAPSIGYWHIAGLNVLVSLFVWRYIPKDDTWTMRVNVMKEQWTMGLTVLFMGWLFHFGLPA